jgi:predicted lysophospholipase L1 biosynthesis ABC-type transport system permease subunit
MAADFNMPRGKAQMSKLRLLRMGAGNLRLHPTATLLQMATIGATSAFLVFVLGQMLTIRAAAALPTADPNAAGTMAQLTWILAISLLVCAISNVTSMLLSVTKRFKEIGTMKCLGAFDRTILRLFLAEALLLGLGGALAGAAPGAALALALALGAHGGAVFSGHFWPEMAGAFGVSVLVVVALSFAGALYPAWKASRMMPIEAMRSN